MDSGKIGSLLRGKREALGLTVATVVERTKIKRSYIEAMERGDFAVFEQPVYIRNFVRTYARFLKIPESDMMAHLGGGPATFVAPVQPVAAASDPVEDAAADESEDKKTFSFGLISVLLVLVLGGSYALMKSRSTPESPDSTETPAPAESDLPPSSSAAVIDSAAADPADQVQPLVPEGDRPPAAQPEQSARPAAGLRHRMEMVGLSDVWLYLETESTRYEKILRSGERQVISFEKFLRLRAGNVYGLRMTLDGTEVRPETSKKVFDKVFRTREDGRVSIEGPGPDAQRLFQFRESAGE